MYGCTGQTWRAAPSYFFVYPSPSYFASQVLVDELVNREKFFKDNGENDARLLSTYFIGNVRHIICDFDNLIFINASLFRTKKKKKILENEWSLLFTCLKIVSRRIWKQKKCLQFYKKKILTVQSYKILLTKNGKKERY